MGTVGLSFGSPTSGTGFDVSSTVSEIVSNLQNVETPWKNQLTSLQSQDTVISNLGTLISTLSTDINSLTDFQGVLAQKEGSSSDTNVLDLSSATSAATAGTHTVTVSNLAQTSSGYLDEVSSASDTLAGSITIKASAGSQTFKISDLSSSQQTLSGLASAINSSGIGVTANVLTDSSGSRLSLVSATSGAAGQMTITSNLTDAKLVTSKNTTGAINYNSTVTGKDANLEIDGVPLTSASNTVTNLIPGVTFQLLSASPQQSDGTLEPVQVVIGNDNSGVETAVNQFVTDYNSLISAINTQEGNDSSGNPEPLFGSPTISLLQQQLLGSLSVLNPSGYLAAISSTDGTTLADQSQIRIAMGNGASATFVVGSGSNSAVPGTYYTDNTDAGGVDNGNTLSGLAVAINAVSNNPLLGYSGTAGSSTITSNGSLNGIANENDTLSGSISIQVGNGTAQTITLDSSDNTLAGLMGAINNAGLGVNASIVQNSKTGAYSLSLESGTAGSAGTLTVTSNILDTNTVGVSAGVSTANGQSTLTLTSETSGASGALTVTSALTANTPAALSYADTDGYTDTTPDGGTFGTVRNSGDTLTGSMTIQVGNGAAQTITLDSSDNTLAGLMGAINDAGMGVNAALNSDGTALTLTSETAGAPGALTVTSNLFDSSDIASSATLNYTSSSDINSLTSLGISVSNDGSLTFDANSLDALLNSDFNGVVGLFQNVDSWGQNFAAMLNNSGTGSSTGVLKLAQNSNSNIESTLNAEVTKEDAYIATQKTKLTNELNQANQILQELPSQLQGMNELYSAITGYNEGSNG